MTSNKGYLLSCNNTQAEKLVAKDIFKKDLGLYNRAKQTWDYELYNKIL